MASSSNPFRERFPTGLAQPAGSGRFGLDALLLAGLVLHVAQKDCLAPRKKRIRIVELGSGCGAALLACAMELPLSFLGIEREEKLVAASRQNATSLALENVSFERADLGAKSFFRDFPDWSGKSRLVMANPPWQRPGEGKSPVHPLRRRAHCAESDTMSLFCRRASGFLETRGRFCCIVPPRLLWDICKSAGTVDLGLRLVWPTQSHSGEDAKRLMLVFAKNTRADPAVRAPLILHSEKAGSGLGCWTREAMTFMPWLQRSCANQERGESDEFCG